MYSTSDIRKGLRVEFDGYPYEVIEFLHVKVQQRPAFVRTKVRNMITGAVLEKNIKSGEKLARPDLVNRNAQFLYKEDANYVFMITDTYDQVTLTPEAVGDAVNYLQENDEVQLMEFNGAVVSVSVANFVILPVVQTDPGVRGDTVQGGSKPATLSTGFVVTVPLFIKEGDKVRVDTRTGEYMERA